MSWITVVWSMNAGACFVLAGVCFVVWCKERESWPHLLFSCSGVAAAVIALIELAMLHGTTVGQYAALIRWIHVPVWVLTLSFVAFVRLYLHAGRRWLAWSIYGLRTLVLILNFISTPNINFRAITSIRQFSWWGEIVSVAAGAPNPGGLRSSGRLRWRLIFSVDATRTVWRRGDRERALVVGGSMILGAIVAWHVPLVIWGVIDVPFFLSFAYSGIVLAMGYELSKDMLQTAQLAHKLERSEQRLNLAADSANFGVWEWDLNKDEVSVTPSRRDLLGLPAAGEIKFEHFLSRVHADDRDRIRQAIKDAIEKRKVYDSEFRVVLPDGGVRWMTARGTVQANKRGKPMRMLGISLDVTGRQQAELQARQQRVELEQLRQQKTALLEKEVEEHLRAERSAEADRASLIAELANGAARQVRLTARTLEGADGVGDLKTALRSLAANMSENCGVKVTVKADSSSLPISPPVAAQLYRVAQEAMRNAIEHGAAREVLIQLTFGDQDLMLTVQDDGKGFDANVNGQGMGLRIMRYRAQCIGGSCEVHAGPTQGTIVHCRVPLEAQPAVFGLP